jgi:hypothetical protein
MLGTEDWYTEFYRSSTERTLFGEQESIERVANVSAITSFFLSRLKGVFPGVAGNPLPLFNSRNSPIFLLCFATANPYAVRPAVKIAQHILGSGRSSGRTRK